MYAKVAFPIPYDEFFTYRVPADLQSVVTPGMIVTAQLGAKPAVGVILEIDRSSDFSGRGIKEIDSVGSTDMTISAELLALLKSVALRYGTTSGMAIKSALPPGTLQRKKLYLYPGPQAFISDQYPEVQELLDRILAAPGTVLYNKIKSEGKRVLGAVDILIRQGKISLSPFKTGKSTKETWLAPIVKSIPDNMRLSEKARSLLAAVLGAPRGINKKSLSELGFSSSIAATLQKKGLIEFELRDKTIADIGGMVSLPDETVVELTLWQRAVLASVEEALAKDIYRGILLFGVTSSGKTQVYLEAARSAMAAGKSVLVLVPEISLTPQIVVRFQRALGIEPSVWHSRLSPGERAIVFRQVNRGEKKLVIGARSAIFSPLENLGLIIVDEEQDNSFKQEDPAPRYNARDLAIERGKLSGATVILGSATPSAESYQAARKGDLELHILPQRVAGKKPPKIEIISTAFPKDETKKTKPVFPRGFWPISEKLHTEISIRLKNNEQVILLLNRRGYSSSVVCFECGWLGKCPDCDIGWTYHKTGNKLVCHFCGLEQKGPTLCPECGSARLSFRGAGTEKLEETLKDLFPKARVKRLDSDSATGKWEARDILDEFGHGKIDILLGTQMVAKGHHFPSVAFVGVIGADVGLSLPDFRASERVLQLLIQAAGRAGRSSRHHDPGLVMIQSFSPQNPIFGYLLKDDYGSFLDDELTVRQALRYPPFSRLILIETSSANSGKAMSMAGKIKGKLNELNADRECEILGPSKSAIFKRGKQYRFQILIKTPVSFDSNPILASIRQTARESRGVSVKIDVDPVNFL